MKHHILLLLSLLLISCNKTIDNEKREENNSNDSIIIYSESDLYKINEEKIKVIDTACINEEKKATADIKNGKIVYYFFNGMTEMYRSNKEMQELLLKHNIQIDSALTSCFLPLEGFRRNCYISMMAKEIEKRHGKNFIDSIRALAEKKYVQTHPNTIYKFEECDTISRYPGATTMKEFFSKPEIAFFNNFNYPKDYSFKKERSYSYTSAYFILRKDGTITDLEVEATFQNTANKKHAAYFEKAVKDFVQKVKWIPAKKKGIPVDSEMDETFTHK